MKSDTTDAAPDALTLMIFDCDGVLVDSESISSREMARSINELGLPLTYDEVKRTFKGESLANMQSAVERELGHAVPDGWLEDFQARRAAAFKTEIAAVEHAEELVLAVQAAGLGTCVASQASLEKMHLTLGLTGLRRRFSDDRLFSSAMVKRGKPAPDLFLHAARECGHDPSNCVVIEDGVAGVKAAGLAGMRVFGYAADSDADALAAAGAEIVLDLRELLPMIAAKAPPRG